MLKNLLSVLLVAISVAAHAETRSVANADLFGVMLVDATKTSMRMAAIKAGLKSPTNYQGSDLYGTRTVFPGSNGLLLTYDRYENLLQARYDFDRTLKNMTGDPSVLLAPEHIARLVAAKYGQPEVVEKGSWPMPTYRSYWWKSDDVVISVDRGANSRHGPVYLTYHLVKKIDDQNHQSRSSKANNLNKIYEKGAL